MASISYPKYDTLPQILTSRGDPEIFSPKGPLNNLTTATAMSMPAMTASGGGVNNSLIPFRQSTVGGSVGGGAGGKTDESSRVRALEMRLMAAEQSNRTVLEEVVRLQNEMRVAVRRLEEGYRAEVAERTTAEQTERNNRQSVAQMAARLQQVEQTLEQGQSSVNNLSSQMKRLEQNLMTAQRDVLQRNDTYFTRLNSVSQSVEEWSQDSSKYQSAIALLATEVKQVKHALEVRALEYQTLQQDVHKRSAQMENESQSMVDYFRKTQDHQSDSEYQQQQLRSNIESRLLEVRDSLVDLRNRFLKEESERRNTEQALTKRLSEEHTQIAEQSRQMEDLRHELIRLSSSTNQTFDRERVEHSERLMKSEDEQKRKMHSLEMEVKNELIQRISDFEKLYQTEKEHRYAAEKVLRDEAQTALNEMQKKIDTEIAEIKKKAKADKVKYSSGYAELNKSAELIDRKHSESYDKLTRLLKAEITTRESQDQAVSTKADELNHKLGVAIKTMQTTISSLEMKYKELKDDYKHDMEELRTESQMTITRSLGDLETRVDTLTSRMREMQKNTDTKLEQVEASVNEKSAKMTQQLSQWHEQMSVRVTELQEAYGRLKPQVTELQSQLGNYRLETNSRIEKEQETRQPTEFGLHLIDEVHQLRMEVDKKLVHVPSKYLVNQLEENLNNQRDDLDLALAECKRIGDALVNLEQSCDTRLTDETTMRTEQLTELRESIKRLRKLVDAYHNPTAINNPDPEPPTPRNPAENPPIPLPDAPKIVTPSSSNPDPDRWQDENANGSQL
ncbi:uncharacterized protein LOC142344782 isoform X2 [Convolutriloba macropyga]|uniref:uncharacterized protein LOC142344782 isoform X2 n=1 Tax=Convolutriloba macropyga TaxID=536237 RepID=UPI003F51E805